MDHSTTIKWLSTAIEKATRSAKFCIAGCLPVVDPGIEVDGLGTLEFPLKRARAKELVAHCHIAPYGKGTKTLIDKKVRSTFELDPQQFRLNDAWNAATASVMRSAAEQLGLPAEQLEARLHKLLVYEKGGFFLPHRDSEKHDRMVASMIVVLPNRFEGGTLVVRHGAAEQKLAFDEAGTGKAACYAAFYADCEHEVQRVTGGVRICLAYNLVLKPRRAKPSAAAPPAAPTDVLADSIGSWVASQPAKPLVFALEHQYTQRGLSLDLLKGADRQLADLVMAAADKVGGIVHLAQVSRHLLQFADDGSFARSYSRYGRAPRRDIEIGETYEDDLGGTDWTDVRGKKQPWGKIAFDRSAIVSSSPLEDWQPTSEEFEGYTGNAGNTLDRWYHRSAITVWQRSHHFDVVASSGAAGSIPLFCSMAGKLAKTPKKRLDAARCDCIYFARAIIARWPRRGLGYVHSSTIVTDPYDDFPEHLLMLHDRDTIAMFLLKVAQEDRSLPLTSLILAACREFGWAAFGPELSQLIAPRISMDRRSQIPLRDVEWLSAYCCDESADPAKSSLAQKLCTVAAERACQPRPASHVPHQYREPGISDQSVTPLLKALVVGGHDEDLTRVIAFVQKNPKEFGLDDCQVPCLKSLISWSRKQFGSVHPQFASWLVAVREQLESAISSPPAPPADWARPADVACKCQRCAQLKAFLADAASEIGRIPAREDMRRHLVDIINQHQCDVQHAVERTGSPFSLVLTKTRGSFERAVKRFEADRRLLSALPVG